MFSLVIPITNENEPEYVIKTVLKEKNNDSNQH